MQKTSLNVVVADRPPFVFVNTSSETQYQYTGMLIDLLDEILASRNISTQYEVQPYPLTSNTGGVFNGTAWTGIVGELTHGPADVALFPLTQTAARLNVIDCTFSYLDSGLGVLVRADMESPGPLAVLTPFSATLWVLLLCTVLGVMMLFWVLDVYGRWIRTRQAKLLEDSGEGSSRRGTAGLRKGARNHILVSLMAAAGAAERPERSAWGVQVLYIVYSFFCLIVISSYTANLTSFLAVKRADTGINSLQDLARKNEQLAVTAGGSNAAYFTSSQDSVATQLQPNLQYCQSYRKCVEWVRKGVVAAFVSDAPPLIYFSQQQPCDLAVVGEPFGPGNLVIGLRKNSPLLRDFNAAIQQFSEDGTLSRLRRTWFDEMSQCDDSDVELDNSRLTLGQMLGAFAFLGLGVLAAFIAGTIESVEWALTWAYLKKRVGNLCGCEQAAEPPPPSHVPSRRTIFNRLSTSQLSEPQHHRKRVLTRAVSAPPATTNNRTLSTLPYSLSARSDVAPSNNEDAHSQAPDDCAAAAAATATPQLLVPPPQQYVVVGEATC